MKEKVSEEISNTALHRESSESPGIKTDGLSSRVDLPDKPMIYVIAPFHNEEDGVDAFIQELVRVLHPLNIHFRILCIDDGSMDGTIARLLFWRSRNSRVEVIELSRNFGKEAAITAGLDRAYENGADAAVILDSDLQHPPRYIPEMLEKWRAGFDTVVAHRIDRKTDGRMRSSLSRNFYAFINKISEVSIPEGVGDFRLLGKDVVASLLQLRESKRFMKGLYSWAGFRTTTIEYVVSERYSGASKFRFWRLWNFALEGITSFSTFPLRIWTYVGFMIGVLAMVYGTWITVKTLVFGIALPGYASILTAILFLGGIQLIGIGILGEYLGRTYIESKRRPPYIIRKIHECNGCTGETL